MDETTVELILSAILEEQNKAEDHAEDTRRYSGAEDAQYDYGVVEGLSRARTAVEKVRDILGTA